MRLGGPAQSSPAASEAAAASTRKWEPKKSRAYSTRELELRKASTSSGLSASSASSTASSRGSTESAPAPKQVASAGGASGSAKSGGFTGRLRLKSFASSPAAGPTTGMSAPQRKVSRRESRADRRRASAVEEAKYVTVGRKKILAKEEATQLKPCATFVDYTVVPLLLRSGMEYEVANGVGEILKGAFSHPEVEESMSSAESLLQLLEDERICMDDTFRVRLETDKFWQHAGAVGAPRQNAQHAQHTASANRNRKSFVYFRSDERGQDMKDRADAARQQRASMPPPPPKDVMRRRSQFNGGRVQIQSYKSPEAVDISDQELDRLARIALNRGRSNKALVKRNTANT